MLVYGSAVKDASPRELLSALHARLRQCEVMAPGLERHAALVSLFIDSGSLAQGVLDQDFAERRHDDPGPLGAACVALPFVLAQALQRSWETGFASVPPVPAAPFQALGRLPLPERVGLSVPEGYAYHALYPEQYLEAAKALHPPAPPLVVGIRGIGASLACAVAAAMKAPPPLTVRPTGHPYQRVCSLGPGLERELLARAANTDVAIVDEGPGLSGSSFGAVADFLEDHGVSARRLCFFPSHAGAPGPMASERHRTRWAQARRHLTEFDALFLQPGDARCLLARWCEDLTGRAHSHLEDLGAGTWRRLLFPDAREWPPVHIQQERRKYRVTTPRGVFLLKFAGLGGFGEHRMLRARQLAQAGFTPPVEGLRHGFLVQRWMEDARPLSRVPEYGRQAMEAQVGGYLGFRARHFPVDALERGASVAALLDMARYNTAQVLGEASCAREFDGWSRHLGTLAREVRHVETDNKLQPWEWLVLADGRLLKADAVDHHAGHDLIGCQDVAWDVVGAAVELGFDVQAEARLAEHVARASGRPVSEGLRAFYRPCYLAFQLGHHLLAATALAEAAPEEASRLRRAAERYAALLRA
ncbi:hypothetical protein ACN6A1_28730 [Myxococcus virescens]|uniref:hypothetical protein n=1 Tax=Myxococcus virescens TaxID=83456 RepID=UPI003DA40422